MFVLNKRLNGGNEIILTTEPSADCSRKVNIFIFSYRGLTRKNYSQIKVTYLINAWRFVMVFIHSEDLENM